MSHLDRKTVTVSSLVSAILVISLCSLCRGLPYGEQRIDFEEKYFKYQDIRKVFKNRSKLWLYGTNYQYEARSNAKCIYFLTTSLQEDTVNFTYNVRPENTWIAVPHLGTFFKEEDMIYGQSQEKRKVPNSMRVLKSEGNPDVRVYRLVYDENNGCLIFRVPGQLQGLGCMVVQTEAVLGSEMDERCKNIYKHACGESPPLTKAYEESCKSGAPGE